MRGIKGRIRDLMPASMQVPVKYLYGRLRKELEPEMALLPSLVRRGDRVLDVGGNRGTYAYRFEQLGARVEVFEPNPVCLRVLAPWAQGRRSVSVHAVALSATNGSAELAIPIDGKGVEHDASASIEHGVGANADARLETVPIRTLDSFGYRDAALIKIDVEGHEQSVIDGARETIAASTPALLIEIEQRHVATPIRDILAGVEALGYAGYFLCDDVLRPIADFDPGVHQKLSDFQESSKSYLNNFLFLHSSKLRDGTYGKLTDRWGVRGMMVVPCHRRDDGPVACARLRTVADR